ncbi:MAG: phosphatidate cytidylyltransferase [Acidobacteriota bacterium]|nr:phosphatidate cytidylyltransferase [Acidobacteriota bacterium]
MKRILTALVLIPLVLLAVFRAPLWLFLILCLMTALLCLREYASITQAYGMEPFRLLSYLYTAALFVMYYGTQDFGGAAMVSGILLVLLFSPFLLLIACMAREDLKQALPSAAMSYLSLAYIGLPLLILAILRDTVRGWVFVLFTFFAVWVGDTAAMYVGKSMGRHKLAPRISPGKTVEGTVASLVFAVAVCTAFAHYVPEIATGLARIHLLDDPQNSVLAGMPPYGRPPLWLAAVVAAVINVAAQVGDLVESALKRGAGVKDSGNILPGHGGMLDRIDALLLALPVAFLLFLAYGRQFVAG